MTAVPAGIIAGSSTIGHAIMDKPIHMLRAVPFPALSPLLIVLLGIGEAMKVALIAIGVFALIYVNVRDGVRGIDPKLLELAQAYHLPKRTVFAKILLRGTLPRFMTGLRFALTVSWIALVTCETVNSSAGIGYVLSRSQQFYRTDQMVLCIVLYALWGCSANGWWVHWNGSSFHAHTDAPYSANQVHLCNDQSHETYGYAHMHPNKENHVTIYHAQIHVRRMRSVACTVMSGLRRTECRGFLYDHARGLSVDCELPDHRTRRRLS